MVFICTRWYDVQTLPHYAKKNVLGIVLYDRFIRKANLQQSANKVNG